jgi:hypothetical protein
MSMVRFMYHLDLGNIGAHGKIISVTNGWGVKGEPQFLGTMSKIRVLPQI